MVTHGFRTTRLLDEQQDEKHGQVKEDREHWPDEVR